MLGGSFSFAFGPLVALAALGVLILVLRWAFSPRKVSLVAAPPKPGHPREYGLLVPIASAVSASEAEDIKGLLAKDGISSAVAFTVEGPSVLVWPEDKERVGRVLARRSYS